MGSNKLIFGIIIFMSAILLIPLMSHQNAFAGNGECPFVQTPPQPGDILVSDDDAGAFGDGAILGVNPDTGEITVISDFCISDSSPGENFFDSDNEGLAFDPTDGSIVVANRDNVFRVDPNTGGTELISEGQFFTADCGDFDDNGDVEQVAVMDNGDIIAVADDFECDIEFGRVIKIDPDTGLQTLITEGDPLLDPEDVAIDAEGDLIVANGDGPDGSVGGIYRVTLDGVVSVINTSYCETCNPESVDIGEDGTIYVADEDAPNNTQDGDGAVLSIDPDTNVVTIISAINGFDRLTGIVKGSLYVADRDVGCDSDGAIFEINISTGAATIISDNCISTLALFDDPAGLDLFGEAEPEAGGPIFLTCDDPDFHAVDNQGARNLFTIGIEFITNPTTNAFSSGVDKFLFVSSNIEVPGGHRNGINGLTASGFVEGVDFEHHDATTLNAELDLLGIEYNAIVVASDFGGILTDAELEILNNRAPDIISFINQGGGLMALAESNLQGELTPTQQHFGFLPFVVTSAPLSQNPQGVLTDFGESLGLVDGDVAGSPSHCIFEESGLLDVVYFDDSENILSIAGVIEIEEERKSNGGDEAWKTRPTSGINYENGEQFVIRGFGWNGNFLTVEFDHYQPFDKEELKIGERSTLTAKVYAPNGLASQSFGLGIQDIGSNDAEVELRANLNIDGSIDSIEVIQKTDVVDPETITVSNEKAYCKDGDAEKLCDEIKFAFTLQEPLQYEKAYSQHIDFKRRAGQVWVNHGFEITGEQITPMLSNMIPSTVRYEGLLKVTQVAKYSPYWVTDDHRMFEMNSFGSFKQINQSFERFQDTGDARTRMHSGYGGIIAYEQNRALDIFDSSNLVSELPASFAYIFPETGERINEEMRQAMLLQEQIAKEVLDEMNKQNRHH